MYGSIMKTILAALFLLTATPCLAWSTVPEYEWDFSKARECRPIDGRKVWAGTEAYYIQSWLFWTGDSGLLDDEAVSVIDITENTAGALERYAAACQ